MDLTWQFLVTSDSASKYNNWVSVILTNLLIFVFNIAAIVIWSILSEYVSRFGKVVLWGLNYDAGQVVNGYFGVLGSIVMLEKSDDWGPCFLRMVLLMGIWYYDML